MENEIIEIAKKINKLLSEGKTIGPFDDIADELYYILSTYELEKTEYAKNSRISD
jgi:hypothetical protein